MRSLAIPARVAVTFPRRGAGGRGSADTASGPALSTRQTWSVTAALWSVCFRETARAVTKGEKGDKGDEGEKVDTTTETRTVG